MTKVLGEITFAVASIGSALVMLVQDTATELTTKQVILQDNMLRASCIIGATMGAIITIAIFPPKATDNKSVFRALAAKFASSLLIGVAFTPAILRQTDFPIDIDMVIGASTGISIIGVSLMTELMPFVSKGVVEWLKKKLGVS